MALSLSRPTATARGGLFSTPTAGRRTLVAPVRAGLGDLFAPMLKIFAKAEDHDVPGGVATGFKGKISHHGGARQPFKDGYVNKAPVTGAAEAQAGASSYLGEAVQRVMNNNFTGDDTEPSVNTGAEGWQGDIHSRKKDGFHARKL